MQPPPHWPDVPREVKNAIARKLVERELERAGNVTDLLRVIYVWSYRNGVRVETFASPETLYGYALEDAGLPVSE